MRKFTVTALALGGCWWLAGAQGQEAEEEAGPDIDFLEYRGAWAEDDDEWLVIEEGQKGAPDDDEDRASPDTERNEDDESE